MFFFSGNKNEIVLVYDIGNLSVGGALVVLSDNNKPKVVYAARDTVKTAEKPDSLKLLSAVSKSLESVSRDIEKKGLNRLAPGGQSPQRVYCVLSSPWYASQVRTVILKKDRPFTVTKKLIGEIVSDETNNFKRALSASGGFGGDESVLVENDVIKIKLNDYETRSPEGKQALSLSVSAFLSVSPEKVLGSFAEKIRKVFNLKSISFNSFPLAAFSAVKNSFGKQDFIFVDISGETTDVLVSKGGALSEIVTFPMGKLHAVREISNKIKAAPEEALSLFYLYQDKKLSGEEEGRVAEALYGVSENWLRHFRETLAGLSDGFSLPNTVFFTADKDAENWFASLIKKEDYGQFAMTEAPFSVRPVNAESLSGDCLTEGAIKRDQFLMIEAIFAAQK